MSIGAVVAEFYSKLCLGAPVWHGTASDDIQQATEMAAKHVATANGPLLACI